MARGGTGATDVDIDVIALIGPERPRPAERPRQPDSITFIVRLRIYNYIPLSADLQRQIQHSGRRKRRSHPRFDGAGAETWRGREGGAYIPLSSSRHPHPPPCPLIIRSRHTTVCNSAPRSLPCPPAQVLLHADRRAIYSTTRALHRQPTSLKVDEPIHPSC